MFQCRLVRSLQCSHGIQKSHPSVQLKYRGARLSSLVSAPSQPQSLSFKSSDLLESYKQSLHFPSSSKHVPIKQLKFGLPNQDETITLHGYLGHLRTPSKNLAFVEFLGPELDEALQVVSVAKTVGRENHDLVRHSKANSPVVITGRLKPKASPTEAELSADAVPNEFELQDVQFLNKFPADIDPSAAFGPDQRHLQLKKSTELRQALQFRSQVYQTITNKLIDQGYQHIETPLLFKSTSEGAREFLVPTRRDGLAYALPQSPQQYKQLLMASGIPKYFQMARCFRDEDMRADRQPEFTQLDLERSFASGKDIMNDVEILVRDILREVARPYGQIESGASDGTPFQILTYETVMSKYGIDKPDLRLGYSIAKIDHLLPVDLVSKISPLTNPAVDITVLKADCVFGQDASRMRQFITEFLDSTDAAVYHNNSHGGPGIFIYDSSRPLSGLQAFGFEAAEEVERLFEPDDGDLIVLQARPNEPFAGGSTSLGRFMVELNRAAVSQGLKILPQGLQFLWVVDFPLFSPISAEDKGQSGAAGLQSTHHPFTSPKTAEDVDLLLTGPRSVIADHYDLVVNGVEVGGGSRRIHNADVQRLVMEEVLRMPEERIQEFSHLIEALRAGCPPHAGFALGFDRFLTVLLGKESVRDVIAFPKWGRGDDPMVKSPAKVSTEEWDVYKLKPKA